MTTPKMCNECHSQNAEKSLTQKKPNISPPHTRSRTMQLYKSHALLLNCDVFGIKSQPQVYGSENASYASYFPIHKRVTNKKN